MNEFLEKTEKAIKTLEPFSEQVNTNELSAVRKGFISQTEDFYRSDRKLNVGVIGQVKAGKSTFLNTLLFGGKKILPSARTPKTAVLTKIEYDENNSLFVEYYTREEWQVLESYAASDIADNEHTAAREIMNMARQNGINAFAYCDKGSETINFTTADELMGKLNDYVGENGSVTPVVKSVTIRMDKPELNEISVIDTPGLNDAIASRTDKTREFMEKCDVVFFLSRASQFLDSTDMQLVTSQLPQKGVENLILIGSQFDGGLLDVLRKNPSIEDAMTEVSTKLTAHAADIIKSRTAEGTLSGKFLSQCRQPIFISSMAYNASLKDESEYTADETFYTKKLTKKGADRDMLRKIGNMDTVISKFNEIIEKKDITLQSKAAQLVPNAEKVWQETVRKLSDYVRDTLRKLQTEDKGSLEKQKKFMTSQMSEIKTSLENVLGELMLSLESAKNDCMRKLRDGAREYSKLTEKTGTETHTGSHIVGQKSFLGFKWGGHRETYTYETSYTYLATADALENVRSFGYDACSDIEASFMKAVDVKSTKRRLIQTILDNFDTSDENFDINTFRHITDATLNRLEFPTIKLDVTSYLGKISNKFSGEVRNSADRSALQNMLSEVMDGLFNEVGNKFTSEVSDFKKKIDQMKNDFEAELLKNITDEYDKLIKQLENKDEEIKSYTAALETIKRI